MKQLNSFRNNETSKILSDNIHTVANMLPNDFSRDIENEKATADAFQPFQLLNGQSQCDFSIGNPQTIIQSFERKSNSNSSNNQSFIAEICAHDEDKGERKKFLKENGLYREMNKIQFDLLLQTPIERCFHTKENYMSTVQVLLEQIMQEPNNKMSQSIIMMTLRLALARQDCP